MRKISLAILLTTATASMAIGDGNDRTQTHPSPQAAASASPAKRRGKIWPRTYLYWHKGPAGQSAAGQTEEFGLGGAWQELVYHLASQYKKGNP